MAIEEGECIASRVGVLVYPTAGSRSVVAASIRTRGSAASMTAPGSIPFAIALHRATVTAVDDDGAAVEVRFGDERVRAAVVHGGVEPRVGDEALVALNAASEWFLLGALGTRPSVSTRDGAKASLERDGDDEVLRLRDARGAVLVEHRAGHTVVRAAEGDLELRADAGSVRVVARDAVTVSGANAGALRVDAMGVEASGPSLRATTEKTSVESRETVVTAERVGVSAERVNVTAKVMESRVGRIVERAQEAYRDVEGTLQQRVGRYRVLAKETWQVLSGRAVLKSRGDVRIDGEKLYLG
jgi:Protein of unknown function (DUF3540)